MRSALGLTLPAWRRRSCLRFTSSSFGGFGLVLASATRTSPLGSTYNHRGLTRFSAKRWTRKPAGAVGNLDLIHAGAQTQDDKISHAILDGAIIVNTAADEVGVV